MTVLRSGSATDVGRVRTSNQDVALEDPDLFAVADGMGGHVGGEVAARVAVDTLRAAFQRQPTVEGLRRAVAEANRAVWRQGQTERGLRGMGTTLTATALVSHEDGRQVIALANVGDSRAYVFSQSPREQLIQVTADHSLAEEKVRQGQLTEAEAAVHPQRHILTRALGVSSDVDVDLWELHLHAGDRILLCSDGLTNEIGDEKIRDVLAGLGDPQHAAQTLVAAALEHGGSDNVTAVVVDVVSADGPAAAGPTSVAAASGASAATAALGAKTGTTPDGSAAHDGGGRGGDGVADRPQTQTAEAAPAGAAGASARASSGAGAGGAGLRRAGAAGAVLAPEASPGAPEGNGAAAPPGPGTATFGGRRATSTPGPLQAAELRRWQSSRRERRRRRRMAGVPRLVTFRLIFFFLLLAGVVVGGYELLKWYAMDDWYVAVRGNHLVVYHGRPGGILWFKPKLAEVTSVTTTQVLSYTLPAVRHERQEPSLTAARNYVQNLHQEYLASKNLSTGTSAVGPQSSTTTTSPSTTTTTVAGG